MFEFTYANVQFFLIWSQFAEKKLVGLLKKMMFFVDTHSHIYLPDFKDDVDSVIERAIDSGVKKIILPAIDKSTFIDMAGLCSRYPGIVYPSIGLHPSSVKENFREEIMFVKEELQKNSYFAIGETGIDLYWVKTFLKQQCESFEAQLHLSLDFDLPVIIHQRESFDVILGILKKPEFSDVRGVFHCFAGDAETAKKCINLGFLIGIGGVVTYKNSKMAEVVSKIPLESILLETDAPFLPPVPYRGKRNEPSYIPLISEEIARKMNCSVHRVAEVTTSNAFKLFSLK